MAESHVATGVMAVPADAGPPTWQPWAAVQANALSRLKTQLQASLHQLDKDVTEATKLLDGARTSAEQLTAHLEAAAWSTWHRYMDEARRVEHAIMEPALKAHADQLAAAATRFRNSVDPVEHAYKLAKEQSNYGKALVQPS